MKLRVPEFLRGPADEKDAEIDAREERVDDLAARFRRHRRENGLGRLFQDAVELPRRPPPSRS